MSINTLTTRQLKTMMDRNDDFVLINVLAESDFEDAHIPGSHNVHHRADNFLERVLALVKTKDQPVVVYCASRECTASSAAAATLEQAAFTNVMDYEDGVAGWKLAGHDVHSTVRAGR